MAKINFGGVEENVVTREEFPLEKALETLKDETIAVIGYGALGHILVDAILDKLKEDYRLVGIFDQVLEEKSIAAKGEKNFFKKEMAGAALRQNFNVFCAE